MQQLYAIADKGYTELEQVRRTPMYLTARSHSAKDASTLDTIIQHGETFMPLLREEHAQIMKELEQEQSVAAEIENCDQEYLNELRATLEEQGYCLGLIARYGTAANAGENSAVLDERRAEVAEAKAKLERLEEKVRDIETTNTETTGSIDSLQQTLHVQENSTYTEALRLKGNVLSLSPEQVLDGAKFPNLLWIHAQTNWPRWNNCIFGKLPGSSQMSASWSTHLAATSTFLAPSTNPRRTRSGSQRRKRLSLA